MKCLKPLEEHNSSKKSNMFSRMRDATPALNQKKYELVFGGRVLFNDNY